MLVGFCETSIYQANSAFRSIQESISNYSKPTFVTRILFYFCYSELKYVCFPLFHLGEYYDGGAVIYSVCVHHAFA